MPSFRVSFGRAEGLGEALTELPPPVKTIMRRGFTVVGRLQDEKLQSLVSLAAETLETHLSLQPDEQAKQIGVTADELRDLIAVASLAIISLGPEGGSTPESFVEEVLKAGLAPAEQRPSVVRLTGVVAGRREQINSALERQNVTSSVLPSLTHFEATVDLRVAFSGDRVSAVYPVVLAYLGTDATHMEVWFQMSKPQTEKLVTDLQAALKKIEQAEKGIRPIRQPVT